QSGCFYMVLSYLLCYSYFFLMLRRQLCSAFFPYTTLFRSGLFLGLGSGGRFRHADEKTARAADVHQSTAGRDRCRPVFRRDEGRDRKSTRLNSSHVSISYAVFCLKKKQGYTF